MTKRYFEIVQWKDFLCIYTLPNMTDGGHRPSSLQVKMACYNWTEEEIQYFVQVIQKKNVTTTECHKVQQKHLQIAIVSCRNCLYFAKNFSGNPTTV